MKDIPEQEYEPRLQSQCPFCGAPIQEDFDELSRRVYLCGTEGSLITGQYINYCRKKEKQQ